MIIARLQGGLGNQMFQYAAAKSLATRLNVPFKLETITSLQKDKQRVIALGDLNANFQLATRKEVKKFVPFPTLYRHKPEFFSKLGRRIYREPHFHYDHGFINLKTPIFLDGFWQSPKYFEPIEEAIRADFKVKEALVKNVIKKGNDLAEGHSIAVHVRRGDFLNPKIAAYHGVLEAAYYQNAIHLIQQKDPRSTIHFFSDDIEWVKQNIPSPVNTEFVSSPKRSAMEDFYLMTKCRHMVIANSSFSWWAAWLGKHPDKIVVAPKNWFVGDSVNTKDLIPSNWIRI
jgi:hypothetical protein